MNRPFVLFVVALTLGGCASHLRVAEPSEASRGLASVSGPISVLKNTKAESVSYGKTDITYPVFPLRSFDEALRLNFEISKIIKDWHCGEPADSFEEKYPRKVSGLFAVDDANAKYISVNARVDYDCGGLNPTSEVNYYIFSTLTGRRIDMEKQFINTEHMGKWGGYSSPIQLAVKYAPAQMLANPDCFPSDELKSQLDQVSKWYHTIGIKDRSVIIAIHPEHAEASCAYSVTVPYLEAKPFIRPDSPLHQWLK